MQIAELMKENLIALDFAAADKKDALDRLVQAVEKTGYIEDIQGLKKALEEREKLGTTGVGGGIAIPHARCSAVKDLTVAFFRSKDGVDFRSIDNKPVHLIFLLLAPLSSGGQYLKLLAKISRLLRHDDFRQALLDAKVPKEIVEIIQERE